MPVNPVLAAKRRPKRRFYVCYLSKYTNIHKYSEMVSECRMNNVKATRRPPDLIHMPPDPCLGKLKAA